MRNGTAMRGLPFAKFGQIAGPVVGPLIGWEVLTAFFLEVTLCMALVTLLIRALLQTVQRLFQT
jgi:cytochrome bd-type quinol oxidase subunit 1